MERYTLSVLVENNPGVLSRVVGLFSRRGFNIHSLSVGTTQDPQVSRITIEVNGDAQIVEQVSKQLSKIMDPHGVHDARAQARAHVDAR